MIIANGVDIVKISRIEKILLNKKDKFINKVFTQDEIEYIKYKKYNSQTIAGLFAAKEAVSKVLGTGLGKVGLKDMEIFHDNRGKPNIVLYNEGLNICQRLGIDNIHLSISHEEDYAIAFVIGEGVKRPLKHIKNILPKRDRDAHKGDFGRVGIIAGSIGMTGASYLSTMAALKAGSGLVYTIIPYSLNSILSIKLIEAIIKPVRDDGKGHFTINSIEEIMNIIKDMDVVALGPGIGVDEERVEFVKYILSNYEGPVVLDADGINCISKDPNILLSRKEDTIITPHMGELSRLLNINIDKIKKEPVKYSKYTSSKYNIITLLKGQNTVVTNNKDKVYINSTGNPGMATAGSGDVLTGMIASFIGQGIKPYDGALLGAYVHGLAGDLAKEDRGEYGMISRDILENIPYAVKMLE